jgi:hypothetical protein
MKYFANEFTAATHTSADEQFDPIKSYVFAGAVSAGAVSTGAST